MPADLLPRDPRRARRIGYVGTSYRLEEFRILWDALVRLSAEYGARLEFEFWATAARGTLNDGRDGRPILRRRR